ncbi:MAG: hypothetical protein ABWY83_05730 [Actinomycetota bacterium]
METCMIATCDRPGEVEAVSDFVTAGGDIFLLEPIALCDEHASLLGRYMVELRYPDGSVVKPRKPGQRIPPPGG